MRSRPNLPIGTQSFEVLRTNQNVYVDKTRFLYDLVTTGRVYFLSRPRRFGKSLLVTTLQALFLGKKELFENLWITQNTNYGFEEYPVLLFDLSMGGGKSVDELKMMLNQQIDLIAERNHLVLEAEKYDLRFAELIRKLKEKTGKPVVILVDEYDKPILDNINNPEVGAIRDTLRQFYTIIKASDAHLHFVFLTGVSKFSRVSVFSGLNNLKDISMDQRYAALCGYTQEELESTFGEWIQELSNEHDLSVESTLDKIREWYNGYQFSTKTIKVYNPFSTLLMFDSREFKPHWFETGTPSMLIRLLETRNYPLNNLEQLIATEEMFSVFDVENLQVAPLFFQTGYLTIQGYDPEYETYQLGYPNKEVRHAFLRLLLASYTSNSSMQGSIIQQLSQSVREGTVETFMEVLRSFFAGIPYDIQPSKDQREKERYYQSIFYVIFALLGVHVKAEERTSTGRIDAVIETENYIFIFEFKMASGDPDKICDTALQQIREHEYFVKYAQPGQQKNILLIGTAFDLDERGIVLWKTENMVEGHF
ncbi:MAG: ATP-binding protein [SAR324 cluster bacterium]|nr:ATP-binding protein [SAR324 cluster bacterium]